MTIHSCVPQRYSRVFVVGECGLNRLYRMVRKILHEGVRFIEQGIGPDPKAKKKRAQMLARALRKLGYEVTITPINLAIAENGMQV
jgi:hypothetical protein